MIEAWRESLASIASRPLATAMTATGVGWGAFALVATLGFSAGLERAAERTVHATPVNVVYLWGGWVDGRWVGLARADAPALAAVPGVDAVAARLQREGWVDGGGRAGRFLVQGDEPAAWRADEVRITRGRALDPLDEQTRAPVAVLGPRVVATLFPGGADPIGAWVVADGVPVRVVGVSAAEVAGETGERADRTVRVPFSTASRAFGAGDDVTTFVVLGAEGVAGADIAARARGVVAERHGVPAARADRLGAFDADRFVRRIRRLFTAIRAMTWAIGAATTASGAIGVGHLLVVTVRERTPEIGLRRAIGATRASIVGLVLREVALTVGGAGGAGLALGCAAVGVGRGLVGPDHPWFGQPELRLGQALGLVVVVAGGGLLAAMLPVIRAAAVSPVDALRGE